MVQGIDALSYSANIALRSKPAQIGEGEELSSWAIAVSIVSALVLGMGLFVALPHFLTARAHSRRGIGHDGAEPAFSSDRRHAQDGRFCSPTST